MLVKFFSCVCAVGAGLPIGPEGPMIHLGYVNQRNLQIYILCNPKINIPQIQPVK